MSYDANRDPFFLVFQLAWHRGRLCYVSWRATRFVRVETEPGELQLTPRPPRLTMRQQRAGWPDRSKKQGTKTDRTDCCRSDGSSPPECETPGKRKGAPRKRGAKVPPTTVGVGQLGCHLGRPSHSALPASGCTFVFPLVGAVLIYRSGLICWRLEALFSPSPGPTTGCHAFGAVRACAICVRCVVVYRNGWPRDT